jgi:hypothetical protein
MLVKNHSPAICFGKMLTNIFGVFFENFKYDKFFIKMHKVNAFEMINFNF